MILLRDVLQNQQEVSQIKGKLSIKNDSDTPAQWYIYFKNSIYYFFFLFIGKLKVISFFPAFSFLLLSSFFNKVEEIGMMLRSVKPPIPSDHSLN